jgi:hypothetical protein
MPGAREIEVVADDGEEARADEQMGLPDTRKTVLVVHLRN